MLLSLPKPEDILIFYSWVNQSDSGKIIPFTLKIKEKETRKINERRGEEIEVSRCMEGKENKRKIEEEGEERKKVEKDIKRGRNK